MNSHALPVYKKNRIASLLCIFETIIADEIAKPRPDMNYKVTAFTESKKFYSTIRVGLSIIRLKRLEFPNDDDNFFYIPEDYFTLTNSIDPDETLHFVAFYLGPRCLLKYTFRSLQYAEDYYCAYRISVDIAFLFLNVFNIQFLTIQRGTCIKGLIWPPLEPKTESCFSSISSCWLIRRMVQMLNSGIYFTFTGCYGNQNGRQNGLKIDKLSFKGKI